MNQLENENRRKSSVGRSRARGNDRSSYSTSRNSSRSGAGSGRSSSCLLYTSSLIESARIDGAGNLKIMFQIVFPITVPGMISIAIYGFVWSWNDLLYSMTLVTDATKRTLASGLVMTCLLYTSLSVFEEVLAWIQDLMEEKHEED